MLSFQNVKYKNNSCYFDVLYRLNLTWGSLGEGRIFGATLKWTLEDVQFWYVSDVSFFCLFAQENVQFQDAGHKKGFEC